MADTILEQRVTNLEELMADLIATVDRVDRQLDRTDRQIERTERNLDRLSSEMRDFKDEMQDFKDETRESTKQMNRKWGDLANKMGTMAEDLVAPSIGRILRTVVECPEDEVDFVAVRVRKRHPATGQMREFDVVAACGDFLLINETKSSLNDRDMREFVELLPEVRPFFPEFSDRHVIGAIASLYVDEGLVRFGERLGLIVLGFGEDVMDVLNSPEFEPATF